MRTHQTHSKAILQNKWLDALKSQGHKRRMEVNYSILKEIEKIPQQTSAYSKDRVTQTRFTLPLETDRETNYKSNWLSGC